MIRNLLCSALFLTAAATAQETYSTWTKYKVMTLTPQTALTGAVTTYPMLVRLDSVSFAGQFGIAASGANGSSIRFTDSAGTTRFPHQRERWDSVAHKAEFWVLLPQVKGGTSATKFRMYWGKNGAADSSSGAQVFTAANGFGGVWHLGDSTGVNPRPNQVSGGPVAALKNFDATYFPSGYVVPEGIIGRADTVTGGACDSIKYSGKPYLDLNPDRTSYAPYNTLGNGTGFTWSGWYYDSTAASSVPRYFSAGPDSNIAAVTGGNPTSTVVTGRVIVFRATRTLTTRWGTNGTPISTDPAVTLSSKRWQYITVTKAAGLNGVKFYVNGTYDGQGTTPTGTGANDVTRLYAAVGRSNCATGSTSDSYLSGSIDELQLSTVVRGDDWVSLNFQTQCNASVTGCPATSPLAISAENPAALNGRVTAEALGASLDVRATAGGLLFQVNAGTAASARVSLVDMAGHTVWSRSVNAGAVRSISWDGRTRDGSRASAGMYVARVSLLDASKNVKQSLDRTVPFTP